MAKVEYWASEITKEEKRLTVLSERYHSNSSNPNFDWKRACREMELAEATIEQLYSRLAEARVQFGYDEPTGIQAAA